MVCTATFDRYAGYQAFEVVGSGGMSLIRRAVDVVTGEQVALKTPHGTASIRRYALRQEIDILSSVALCSCVRMVEHGQRNGEPWCALELLNEGDFERLLRTLWGHHGACTELGQSTVALVDTACSVARESAPFSGVPARAAGGQLSLVLPIVLRLAQAIRQLHAAGICHGDIKPSNVMMRGEQPVLIDFGLSRPLGQRTPCELLQQRYGTPAFMAPEGVQGNEIGAAYDLYSFGCLLYTMLVGRPPFVGSTTTVLELQRTTNPIAATALVEGLSAGLAQLLAGLLQKDPVSRPSIANVITCLTAEIDLGAASTMSPRRDGDC